MTALIEEVQASDRQFHRPAAPSIYAEYLAYIETGAYPYIDSVVSFIAERHGMPFVGQHHAQYAADPLGKKLSHEVYLASTQYRLAAMVDRYAVLRGQGYRPITELEPRAGMRIEIEGCAFNPLRCVPIEARHGGWALMPPRRRTHGLNLSDLQRQHRAYLDAIDAGNLSMNGPAVVMYRPL